MVRLPCPIASFSVASLCILLDLCWFEELWAIAFLLPEQAIADNDQVTLDLLPDK